MIEKSELERRLAQCRRLASESFDALTKQRLQKLAFDLEEQLRPVPDT